MGHRMTLIQCCGMIRVGEPHKSTQLRDASSSERFGPVFTICSDQLGKKENNIVLDYRPFVLDFDSLQPILRDLSFKILQSLVSWASAGRSMFPGAQLLTGVVVPRLEMAGCHNDNEWLEQ